MSLSGRRRYRKRVKAEQAELQRYYYEHCRRCYGVDMAAEERAEREHNASHHGWLKAFFARKAAKKARAEAAAAAVAATAVSSEQKKVEAGADTEVTRSDTRDKFKRSGALTDTDIETDTRFRFKRTDTPSSTYASVERKAVADGNTDTAAEESSGHEAFPDTETEKTVHLGAWEKTVSEDMDAATVGAGSDTCTGTKAEDTHAGAQDYTDTGNRHKADVRAETRADKTDVKSGAEAGAGVKSGDNAEAESGTKTKAEAGAGAYRVKRSREDLMHTLFFLMKVFSRVYLVILFVCVLVVPLLFFTGEVLTGWYSRDVMFAVAALLPVIPGVVMAFRLRHFVTDPAYFVRHKLAQDTELLRYCFEVAAVLARGVGHFNYREEMLRQGWEGARQQAWGFTLMLVFNLRMDDTSTSLARKFYFDELEREDTADVVTELSRPFFQDMGRLIESRYGTYLAQYLFSDLLCVAMSSSFWVLRAQGRDYEAASAYTPYLKTPALKTLAQSLIRRYLRSHDLVNYHGVNIRDIKGQMNSLNAQFDADKAARSRGGYYYHSGRYGFAQDGTRSGFSDSNSWQWQGYGSGPGPGAGAHTGAGTNTGAGAGAEAGYQSSGERAQDTWQDPVRAAYAELGLPYGADIAEVKKKYHQLLFKYHPDHISDYDTMSDAEKSVIHERLQKIRSAYNLISLRQSTV